MRTRTNEFRTMALNQLKNEKRSDDKEVNGLIDMVKYYCTETRKTEFDVFENDELYNSVCDLIEKHRDYVIH